MIILTFSITSINDVSAQGGVPVPSCGVDLIRDKDGNCVLTEKGREKQCQTSYGPYSHYDKSKNGCIPREYCQANYGPGYQYDRSQNQCVKTRDNEQSIQSGDYSKWNKYCKNTYGSNYYYDKNNHQCLKSSAAKSTDKKNCASPYISISATRWNMAVIEVDGIVYQTRTLTLQVSPGTHSVYIVGLNWDMQEVGEWGPKSGYVDYCKPWKITVS